MDGYDPKSFGRLNADDYDALHDPGTTEAAVDLLAALAAGRPTLELAIGTGRVAVKIGPFLRQQLTNRKRVGMTYPRPGRTSSRNRLGH